MAIDSAAKREAVLEHGWGAAARPTGTIDSTERGILLGLYGALIEPPPYTPSTGGAPAPRMSAIRRQVFLG